MKTYQKVLIGIGAATVVTTAAVITVRYQMVKEQEEEKDNSPRGKLLAKGDMVRSRLRNETPKEACPCETFSRRLLKALGIYGFVNKIMGKKQN